MDLWEKNGISEQDALSKITVDISKPVRVPKKKTQGMPGYWHFFQIDLV